MTDDTAGAIRQERFGVLNVQLILTGFNKVVRTYRPARRNLLFRFEKQVSPFVIVLQKCG